MPYLLHGKTGDWEVVIGLEVHAQVIAKAKLFSGAATDFGAPPNSQVSSLDGDGFAASAFDGGEDCLDKRLRPKRAFGLGATLRRTPFSGFNPYLHRHPLQQGDSPRYLCVCS